MTESDHGNQLEDNLENKVEVPSLIFEQVLNLNGVSLKTNHDAAPSFIKQFPILLTGALQGLLVLDSSIPQFEQISNFDFELLKNEASRQGARDATELNCVHEVSFSCTTNMEDSKILGQPIRVSMTLKVGNFRDPFKNSKFRYEIYNFIVSIADGVATLGVIGAEMRTKIERKSDPLSGRIRYKGSHPGSHTSSSRKDYTNL